MPFAENRTVGGGSFLERHAPSLPDFAGRRQITKVPAVPVEKTDVASIDGIVYRARQHFWADQNWKEQSCDCERWEY